MKMLEYLVMCMSVQVEGEPEGQVQNAIKQTVDCLQNAEVGVKGMK